MSSFSYRIFLILITIFLSLSTVGCKDEIYGFGIGRRSSGDVILFKEHLVSNESDVLPEGNVVIHQKYTTTRYPISFIQLKTSFNIYCDIAFEDADTIIVTLTEFNGKPFNATVFMYGFTDLNLIPNDFQPLLAIDNTLYIDDLDQFSWNQNDTEFDNNSTDYFSINHSEPNRFTGNIPLDDWIDAEFGTDNSDEIIVDVDEYVTEDYDAIDHPIVSAINENDARNKPLVVSESNCGVLFSLRFKLLLLFSICIILL